MAHLLILNGPNLNLLGKREPAIYGRQTLADIEARLAPRAERAGASLEMRQSNHEGKLLDWLHEAGETADGVAINPGALAHTSIALADAVAAVAVPVIEVHLSNVFARERFRQHSYISARADGLVSGLGPLGYELAVDALLARLQAQTEPASG